jgi:molecular chaperone GrpE
MSEDTKNNELSGGNEGQDAAQTTEQLNELEAAKLKITEFETQCGQLKDQLLRKAAEFENYKRRTENDFLNLSKYAGENIITQLLPVLDDFIRSLKIGKEKLETDPFYKGIELIHQKLMKVLENQGLKAMEVVGKEFDVDYHDALMQIPNADVPPHTVLEEAERGYMLAEKVIRHAKVVVSMAPAGTTEESK